jgi:hypothetical protein
MDVPVMPPILPMPATSMPTVPESGGYSFEPQWGGFRRS